MFPAIPFLVSGFFRKNALKIVGLVGVVLIIGFAYYQYQNNIKLQAENYNLQATVFETKARLNTVVEQAGQISKINNDMIQKERALTESLFELSHKFTKNGRDFENLARRKPGLIEPIINNATDEMLRCIEQTTVGKECEK